MSEFAFTELLPLGPDTTPYRLVSTDGVGPVQAFMNATRSAFSCAESLRGRIFSLRLGFAWPPLSYHSTTSSSVATEPSCM